MGLGVGAGWVAAAAVVVGASATVEVVDVDATGGVVVGDGCAGEATVVVVPGAGTAVVVGNGCGRLPGLGVVTTGAAVGVGDAGTVVGGAGITPRRGPGGTMAGLLGALTSFPMSAASSQRRGFAGARSTVASMRPSSFLVVVGSSNSISFSIGAFSPSASWRHVIL